MQNRPLSSLQHPRRMIGSRILLAIALCILALTGAPAADFTYSEFGKAADPWKRGFVYGISRYMTAVAQPDEEPPYPTRAAFQRCLGGASDVVLVRHVETYAAKNPAASKGPMVSVVVRALFDFCRLEVEKR